MKDFKFEHLVIVRDKITGFQGTITGRSDYPTGCNTYCVAPKVKDDGAHVQALWFDEDRLEIVADAAKKELGKFVGRKPGGGDPPPKTI